MKYFYSFIILILFLGCEKNKTSWPAKVEIPEEIKDEKFYKALEQSIKLAEENNVIIGTIYVNFAANNLYLFITNGSEDCFYTPYKKIITRVNNTEHLLVFEQEENVLEEYIDITTIVNIPISQSKYYACESKGFILRFERSYKNSDFYLKELTSDLYDDNIILEDDKKYFPMIEIPEPENPEEN